jgi:Xaa-Pro dipeptidase
VDKESLDQRYVEHIRILMQRADRALAAGGFDAMVIHAGSPPTQFLDDQDYPFKVNPHFKAWVPIVDNPHCVLIYAPGSRPKVLFYQPNDYWHIPAATPAEPWTQEVELIPIAEPSKASAHWAKLGKLACIGPADVFEAVPDNVINPPDLLRRLHFERAVKTAYELECMRRANDLGALGHRAALAAFRRGDSEFEAHMHYLEASVQREEELPYNSIVAYNEHSSVLHYQRLDRQAPPALRSFLIDAGAQYRGYASDITRSYAAAPGVYRDLIGAVNEVQLALCAEIVSGRDYREVHLSAHRMLGDLLQRCGLTTLPGQAALELGVTGVFFPHGIGHLLGLQVHDVGGVMADSAGHERERPQGHPYLRLTRMLEPGVVVTIEPGIYMIDSLLAAAHADARRAHINWPLVETLRPFGGIRIEDNVITTARAPENMTRDAFARLSSSVNA